MGTANTEHEELLRSMGDRVSASLEEMVLGLPATAYAQTRTSPPLTYERLMAVHDYVKPETLADPVSGMMHEVYGFKVHQSESMPEGFAVLIEKRPPDEWPPRMGKMVIFDFNKGKAFEYDPAKSSLNLDPLAADTNPGCWPWPYLK